MKLLQLLLLTTLTTQVAPMSHATIFQLEFSGGYQTTDGNSGVHHGIIFLDFAMPDFFSDPNVGFYDAIVDARLYVDDVTWVYDPIPGQFSFVAVSNDDPFTDDTFQITMGLTNEQGTVDTAMTLRFIDPDRQVLSSDHLPTLIEFANFELDDVMDTATNIKIPVGAIPGNQLVTGTVLTASLRPVPLPPAIVYLMSALVGCVCLRRKTPKLTS